jgi:hypothetical protein
MIARFLPVLYPLSVGVFFFPDDVVSSPGGGRPSAALHVGVEPAGNARAPAGDQDGELPGARGGPRRGEDRAGERRITATKCDSIIVLCQ